MIKVAFNITEEKFPENLGTTGWLYNAGSLSNTLNKLNSSQIKDLHITKIIKVLEKTWKNYYDPTVKREFLKNTENSEAQKEKLAILDHYKLAISL